MTLTFLIFFFKEGKRRKEEKEKRMIKDEWTGKCAFFSTPSSKQVLPVQSLALVKNCKMKHQCRKKNHNHFKLRCFIFSHEQITNSISYVSCLSGLL